MRVHSRQRPEFAIQKSRDQPAKGGFVARKSDFDQRNAAFLKRASNERRLRALAGPIDAFDNDQLSSSHVAKSRSLATIAEESIGDGLGMTTSAFAERRKGWAAASVTHASRMGTRGVLTA